MADPPLRCEEIRIPVTAGFARVMVICIDTPLFSQNTFDRSFFLELGKAVNHANELANSKQIDLLVICSGKENSFVAGADINNLISYIGNQGGLKMFSDCYLINCVYCAIETLGIPTIAVINSTALGAGLELAMSCDYRVVDAGMGKQIGLPEVKIGVLPGAGGCMRLPYLIGLRPSLPILLTGSSIDPKKAHRLGLVDDLWTQTQSIKEEEDIMKYQWIPELTNCINTGRIGRKRFTLAHQLSTIQPSSPPSTRIHLPEVSQDELLRSINLSWAQCEEKALVKFPHCPAVNPTMLSPLYHALDFLTYVITVIKLYGIAGRTMPAPYEALLCTWNCYHAPSIQVGVAECSMKFSHLIQTAESKSLMSLFLLANQLKKQALDNKPSCPIDRVIVLIDEQGGRYTAQFIQSLLYSDIRVSVVGVAGSVDKGVWQQLTTTVRKLFEYSLSRGHMTKKDVRVKMDRLELLPSDEDREDILVINGCCAKNIPIEAKCSCSIFPVQVASNQAVYLNFGDPVRKNTLSVEISCDTTSTERIKVSSLVSLLGKTPVITPPNSHIGWKLAIAHWSLAIKVVMEMGVGVEYLEKALKDGGFTEGPFTVIKKLDKDVLLHALNELFAGNSLMSYIRSPPIIHHRATPSSKPHPQSLLMIFIANMVVTATDLSSQYKESSDAIDFLSVSGLVRFSPTEGGPISYLKRNGRGQIVAKLRGIKCVNKKLQAHLGSLANDLDQAAVSGCGLSILTDDQLAVVGPCYGARNISSLMYPFPFSRKVLYLAVGGIMMIVLSAVLLWLK